MKKRHITIALNGITEDLASGYLSIEKAYWLVKKCIEYQHHKISLLELNDYFHVPF